MHRYTYRDLIRTYSDGVKNGAMDADLNARERKLCALALNTASNADAATVTYPPTDGERERVVTFLTDALWNGNVSFFIGAVSPSGRDAYGIAVERAVIILRGI